MMKARLESVRNYYNNAAEHEWSRFDRHKFEFPITLRHFKKHIRNTRLKILDVGGGPGRYSIELAKLGHEVFLLDLSEENIKYARKMANSLNANIAEYIVGNACDLAEFKDNQFDFVLNMGPLYHLVEEDDRKSAIQESLRVLKDDGVIAFAFISKYAPLYDTIRRYQNQIGNRLKLIKNIYKNGVNVINENDRNFTDACFFEPWEIEPLMSTFGLRKLSFFGAEGPISQSENQLSKFDDNILEEWIDLASEMSETNAGIMGSDHIVYVGEKDI